MAWRGRMPVYMILMVAVFAIVGLVGFQTLKDRKSTTAILVAKEIEIEKLKNEYVAELQATRARLQQAKEEKDNLSHQVKDLGQYKDKFEDSKKHLSLCEQEKEKAVEAKEREVNALKEKLQVKDSEGTSTKAKFENAELEGKESNTDKVVEPTEINKSSQGNPDASSKTVKDGDENSEEFMLQNAAEQEERQTDDAESLADDRNAASDAEMEEPKVDPDLEVSKTSTANLEESELAATKVVGREDDDKDVETDIKLAASDAAVETNDSLAKE